MEWEERSSVGGVSGGWLTTVVGQGARARACEGKGGGLFSKSWKGGKRRVLWGGVVGWVRAGIRVSRVSVCFHKVLL